jgi:hypothetical protein
LGMEDIGRRTAQTGDKYGMERSLTCPQTYKV